MRLVFIIFGVIIVLSLITGIILTIREKKKNSKDSLTDDPKMLFSDGDSKASSSSVGASVESTTAKEIKSEPAVEKISDSEGFDLPTNHDYNSHKFVVNSIQEKREIPVVSPPEIEEAPVIENKNTARFIYNEEEII